MLFSCTGVTSHVCHICKDQCCPSSHVMALMWAIVVYECPNLLQPVVVWAAGPRQWSLNMGHAAYHQYLMVTDYGHAASHQYLRSHGIPPVSNGHWLRSRSIPPQIHGTSQASSRELCCINIATTGKVTNTFIMIYRSCCRQWVRHWLHDHRFKTKHIPQNDHNCKPDNVQEQSHGIQA